MIDEQYLVHLLPLEQSSHAHIARNNLNLLWISDKWDAMKGEIYLYHSGLIFRSEEEYNKYLTPEAQDLLFKL